jgi:hypothetical protein
MLVSPHLDFDTALAIRKRLRADTLAPTPLRDYADERVAELHAARPLCSCELEEDGDGESGPHLSLVSRDEACPIHGREAEPELWAEDERAERGYILSGIDSLLLGRGLSARVEADPDLALSFYQHALQTTEPLEDGHDEDRAISQAAGVIAALVERDDWPPKDRRPCTCEIYGGDDPDCELHHPEVLADLPAVRIELPLRDIADIVEALELFNGIDEGENTDSERLEALVRTLVSATPGGEEALSAAGAGIALVGGYHGEPLGGYLVRGPLSDGTFRAFRRAEDGSQTLLGSAGDYGAARELCFADDAGVPVIPAVRRYEIHSFGNDALLGFHDGASERDALAAYALALGYSDPRATAPEEPPFYVHPARGIGMIVSNYEVYAVPVRAS